MPSVWVNVSPGKMTDLKEKTERSPRAEIDSEIKRRTATPSMKVLVVVFIIFCLVFIC